MVSKAKVGVPNKAMLALPGFYVPPRMPCLRLNTKNTLSQVFPP